MNGPAKKDKIDWGIGWLEGGVVLAGLVVVLGLITESGPELWQAITTWTWPARAVIGSTIIAVGVFVEVALGFFAARKAKRAETEANERIARAEQATAEAHDRAAKAEKQAAELTASLERSKLPRVAAFASVIDKFVNILKSRPSGNVECMYLAEDSEAMMFAVTLAAGLKAAGWDVKIAPIPPSPFPGIVPSVLAAGGQPSGVAIVTRDISDEHLANTLHNALRECEVFTMGWTASPKVAEGVVRIVVSQKP